MSYTDLGAPQSRNERILMNMLGATYDLDDPQSRIEYLLIELFILSGKLDELKKNLIRDEIISESPLDSCYLK